MVNEKKLNYGDCLRCICTLLFTFIIIITTYYVASKTADATSVGIIGGIVMMLSIDFIKGMWEW